jgi:glycosyltransferase involved in cell wall biosynthesis
VKNKFKICFVATVDTAITSFLANHLRELAKLYELTIITNTSNPALLSEIGVDANLIQINFSRKIVLVADIYCLIRLIQIFMKNRFSSIHSITPKAGLLAMLAGKLCFIPTRVHTFTGQVWAINHGFNRLFLKLFDRLIANLATFNIVDSPSQQKFLINENILTIHKSVVFGLGSVSGVDLTRFKPNKKIFSEIRNSLLIPDDAFVFIYLGRLSKDKGILDLANAFSTIENKNVYLLFVGPDEGGFVDQIKRINVRKLDRIKFLGFTKEPERYLACSNVLCLPSYREGFGSVIIEAAAMGIPSIASRIYGIVDATIHNQTGILHRPGDIDGLKLAMDKMLQDQDLYKRLSSGSRRRAIERFDAAIITSEWINFYKSHLS